jgi:hypothetical protein
MKKKFDELDAPLNAQERFQHATIIRLEALIDMVGSIVDHLAKQDNVAVTKEKIETATPEVKPVAKPRAKAKK